MNIHSLLRTGRRPERGRRFAPRLGLLCSALLTLAAGAAQGQYSETDLHDFVPSTDAQYLGSAISLDAAGNRYGTSERGGAMNAGTIWKLTPSGTYTDLHDFGAPGDGDAFFSKVSIDAAGNLYGTAYSGLAYGSGILWELTSSGTYVQLHVFGANSDGSSPVGGVSFDAAGNLYGTAQYGGASNAGMVWELTPSGTYTDLHDFGVTATDGQTTYSGVSFDAAGNLYGTTYYGGVNGKGMVWKLTPSGTYSDLHDFGATATDGAYSESWVSADAAGNLYGTTQQGGLNSVGTVWQLTASGTYKDLYDFGSFGSQPVAGVTLDAAGNLYGTTAAGWGVIWELTPGGAYSVLHYFGADSDGQNPQGGVCFDRAGNIFGTARAGGDFGSGMVWEMTSSGAYLDLRDFGAGLDGQYAQAGVSIDAAGNFYGTTENGGHNNVGMVWKLTPSGTYTDLHDFGATATDGRTPQSVVSFDAAGNAYGTTYSGGATGNGIVWEVTKSGAYLDVHDFGGNGTGAVPYYAGVTFDAAGNLYGSTYYGGAHGAGTVWELTPSGTYTDLYSFGATDADGRNPSAGVSVDAAGNLYGTTTNGGVNNDGMVWKLTASGTYTDLHDFGATATDGRTTYAGVSFDAVGNLYGTTHSGGAFNSGMVWEITASGAYTDLHDFGANYDGAYPQASGVSFDSAGNLYGTTTQGGAFGCGIVWEFVPGQGGGYSDLYDFFATATDGAEPQSGVSFDAAGNLYGTTQIGGKFRYLTLNGFGTGMIWKLSFATATITTSRGESPALAGGVGVSFDATVHVPNSFAGGSVTVTSTDPSHVLLSGNPSVTFNFPPGGVTPQPMVFQISAPLDVVSDTPVPLTISTSDATTSGSSVTVTVKPFINPTPQTDARTPGLVFPHPVVNQGGHIAGTVHVFEAPSTDQTITIGVSTADATLTSAPIVVPAGQAYSGPVNFNVGSVGANETVTVTATAPSGLSTANASFTLVGPVVKSATFTPGTVTAGANPVDANGNPLDTVSVQLTSPVFVDTQLTLSSQNTLLANDIVVAVPAGSSTGTGVVTTNRYAGTVTQGCAFTCGFDQVNGSVFVGRLFLTADAITSIVFSPATVNSGYPASATVTVKSASASDQTVPVTLTPAVSGAPATVTIPANTLSGTYTFTTPYLLGTTATSYTLSGAYAHGVTGIVKATPNSITGVYLANPTNSQPLSSISELDTVNFVAFLAYPAPVSGSQIAITSSIPGIVGSTTAIPNLGQQEGSVPITPTFGPLTAAKAVTLTATYGKTIKTVLAVNPEILSLTFGAGATKAAAVSGGAVVTGTINLFEIPTTASPVTVTIMSTGSSTLPNGTLTQTFDMSQVHTFAITTKPRAAGSAPLEILVQIQGLGYTKGAGLWVQH